MDASGVSRQLTISRPAMVTEQALSPMAVTIKDGSSRSSALRARSPPGEYLSSNLLRFHQFNAYTPLSCINPCRHSSSTRSWVIHQDHHGCTVQRHYLMPEPLTVGSSTSICPRAVPPSFSNTL